MKSYRDIYCEKMGWDRLPHGYEIHHIIPRSLGGTDDFDNLVCVCKCDHQLFTNVQNSKTFSRIKTDLADKKLKEWLEKKRQGIKFDDHDDWKPSPQLQNFFDDFDYIEKWLNNGDNCAQICRDTNYKYGKIPTMTKYVRIYMSEVPSGKERLSMVGKANKGWKHTKEALQKISKASKGRNKGKKQSTETRRKISEARKGKTRGEKHPSSKLTEFEVEQIKRALKDGISRKTLAEVFKISYQHVSKIKNGNIWNHMVI